MESNVWKTYEVTKTFDEETELSDALSDFGKMLFKMGCVNVHTLYDKETGRLYRKLSISVNKKEYK